MSNIKIEKIASNAVSKYITDCRSLVPDIEENDKTPIWDGDIYVYCSTDICNDNLAGRYPLQVKGSEVEHFTEIVHFPVRVNDLKKFAQEGGCVFFVVQELWNDVNEETQTKIFYRFLDKAKISSILSSEDAKCHKSILLNAIPSKKSSFVNEINEYLAVKNQEPLYVRFEELERLLDYLNQLGEYITAIEDKDKRKSIEIFIDSLSSIDCSNGSNWADKIITFTRGIINEAKNSIYEYGVAGLYFSLAQLCESVGLLHSAERNYNIALKICLKYVEEDPETYLPNVANTLSNLGNLHVFTCEFEEAEAELQDALILFRDLSTTQPDRFSPFVALALSNLGDCHRTIGNYASAECELYESLAIIEELETEHPESYTFDCACTLTNLGIVHLDTGKHEYCINEFTKALTLFSQVNTNGQFDGKVALVYNNLGNAYCAVNDNIKAEYAYLESLKINRRLAALLPRVYNPCIAETMSNISEIYIRQGNYSKANSSLALAKSMIMECMTDNFNAHVTKYIEVLRNIAIINIESDINHASTSIEEAITLCRDLYKLSPLHHGELFAKLLHAAVSINMKLNEHDRVKELIDEGNDIIQTLHDLEYKDKQNSMNTTIDKDTLIGYINQNQVAWQKWDGLIEVSHDATSPNYPEISDAVAKCDRFKVVSPNEMLNTSFHDLTEWSTEDDVLVLGDEEILLCVPGHEFEKLVKQS